MTHRYLFSMATTNAAASPWRYARNWLDRKSNHRKMICSGPLQEWADNLDDFVDLLQLNAIQYVISVVVYDCTSVGSHPAVRMFSFFDIEDDAASVLIRLRTGALPVPPDLIPQGAIGDYFVQKPRA